MKIFKLLLVHVLLMMPIISGGDEYIEPVKNNSQLLGCWKRINFTRAAMNMMNKSEPFPLEHQWYCFLENGKYWELLSNKDDNSSMEEKLKMMKIFPGQDYSIPKEGVVLIHHNETNQSTFWVTSTVSKDVTLWGGEIKRSDMLMTIRNPYSKKDIYYRFMRKVKDF